MAKACIFLEAVHGFKAQKTTWEFPKIRGTLFCCPYNMDPTVLGARLGYPISGNSQKTT